MKPFLVRAVACLIGLTAWLPAAAAEVNAAVAANFARTMEQIGAQFMHDTGHTIRFSSGPSGKLYAQIRNGAPMDLFFSADTEKTTLLVAQGLASDPFVYARGRLVLYSSALPVRVGWREVLAGARFRHLAIANPRTAPYGAAALEVLEALELLETVRPRFVHGESVAHAFQFVVTGNAPVGFIALSQVVDPASPVFGKGEYWIVPQELHAPIDQGAAVLERGRSNPAALAFVAFMKSPRALAIIERYGYTVP